jgi:hypothetical protein
MLMCVRERLGTDVKRLRAALEGREGRLDLVGPPDLRWDDVEAERAGRCLNLAQFKCRIGSPYVRQDRQSPKAWQNLAQ